MEITQWLVQPGWMNHAEDRQTRVVGVSPNDESGLRSLFGLALDDAAGVDVTPDTAMTIAAYWRAISLISGTIGKLPLNTFRRYKDDNGLIRRDIETDLARARMLRERPNPEMSAIVVWSTIIANALQWGNGLAEIERDGAGRAVGIWPIHWSRVWMRRVQGKLRYVVRADDIGGGSPVWLPWEDVIHIYGLSFDGVSGLSVLDHARASLGLTIAADRYGARFFGNSGRPSGVIRHPGKLSPEASDRLRRSWSQNYSGSNSQGTAVLEEGMSYEKIGMPPEDAQFIQTRGVQVLDIARWTGVPPHKLYDLSRGTFSNIEHQGSEFREDTIHPWTTRLEQEINFKIYGGREDGGLYVKFDLDELAVPTLAERAEAYNKFRSSGVYNGDELRVKEGMSPLADGSGQPYWMPVNMAIIGKDGLPILPRPADSAPPPELPAVAPDDEGDGLRSLDWLVPIFGDVAERIVKREENAKARSKADDADAWLTGWKEKHGGWIEEQLLPAIRSALLAQDIEDRDGYALDLARGLAAEWCHELTLEPRGASWPETAVRAAMQAVKVKP